MDDHVREPIPDALKYEDGRYVPERFRRAGRTPSPRAARVFSRTLHAVHMPWFLLWLPAGVGVLTTTGRRSGKARHTPVKAARAGDIAYVVSIGGAHALWYKNLRAQPAVRLQLTGGVFEGVARELRADEHPAAYAALCERVHPFDFVENAFHRRGRPTRDRVRELHRAWFDGGVVFAVDLGASAGRRRWPFSDRTPPG
ncbi:nitroreductase family deazaflavin-dependent oxidoreductase [Nocardia sp. NPDC051832]|uniref:nitroreductase family deazaflavin-dependent oxidoreductase n=1 Tax=Nocardia sp. NPDC051832 TaxID=3155673 RepID=UPI0034425BC5